MKSKYLLLLALVGCSSDPVSNSSTNNPQVPVSLLFEHDGCKVYRFSDGGSYRYFANCSASVEAFWNESCGKNCTRSMNVPSN